jgi:tetratricopeptide (TPR) repeat protein
MLSGRRLRRPGSSFARARTAAVLVAVALAGALSLSSSVSHAQSTSDDLARRHFDSGVAYLEESDYDNALKAFQKAYDLSKRPEILLNLATVHERKSDLPAAVAALKQYLEAAPQGEHVETVKLRIQNLEKRLQEQADAKQQPLAPAPAPAPAAPPKAAPVSAAVAAPKTKPEPNRLPAFIALGVGGVMAGGSLVTGIIAKGKYDDAKNSCGHRCSDAQLSSSRTFAISSTVLTGAAVLGVGLGVGLLLTSDGDGDAVGSAAPRFDVALGPKLAAASALWSF